MSSSDRDLLREWEDYRCRHRHEQRDLRDHIDAFLAERQGGPDASATLEAGLVALEQAATATSAATAPAPQTCQRCGGLFKRLADGMCEECWYDRHGTGRWPGEVDHG